MIDAQSLQTIGLLFRSINVSFRQEMDKALREAAVGLSFGEIMPMSTLRFHPGSNGAQLARHSMVSAQAMNSILRKLMQKKYVERRPHPESLRADSWYLTAKGLRLLDSARAIFEAVTSKMLSGLNAQQVKHLECYLRSCSTSLGRPGEE